MSSTSKHTKKKIAIRADKSLNKLTGKVHFNEKLDKANDMLKRVALPK